jgi:hypothetical protein
MLTIQPLSDFEMTRTPFLNGSRWDFLDEAVELMPARAEARLRDLADGSREYGRVARSGGAPQSSDG